MGEVALSTGLRTLEVGSRKRAGLSSFNGKINYVGEGSPLPVL